MFFDIISATMDFKVTVLVSAVTELSVSSWFRFYPRDAMLARVIEIATCLSVRPSVCLSVCPSHAGIVSKRRKLAS